MTNAMRFRLDVVFAVVGQAVASQEEAGPGTRIKPPAGEVQDEELQLAHTLIEAATAETFDYSGYRDTHHERLEQLIEAKLAGTEPVVAPPLGEPPLAGNLMEALRESVARLAPKRPARRNTNGRTRKNTNGRARRNTNGRAHRKAVRRCVTSAHRRKKKGS